MGRYLEEFDIGQVFVTPGRVVTMADIKAFADLTEDHNPVHVEGEFASRSIFGGPISHGPMMIGITFGLLRKLDLLDGTIIALKAVEWSFNAPIKPADQVHVRATVTEARRSSKAPERGVLSLAIEVRNQDDVTVQAGKVTGIMATRPATPA